MSNPENINNQENTESQKLEFEVGSAEYLYNEMRLLSEEFTSKIFDLISSEKVHGYDTNILIDSLMRAIGIPFLDVFRNVVVNVTLDGESEHAVASNFVECFTNTLRERFLDQF